MGRGRGKGKKLTVVASQESSGDEEHLPENKRNGEPEKPMKDDNNQEENAKVQVDGTTIKTTIMSKEEIVQDSGKKRKRYLQVKEDSGAALDDSSTIAGFKVEETTKTIGYRQTGSRRKSKPHRAAEAVAPVMAVYNYKGF